MNETSYADYLKNQSCEDLQSIRNSIDKTAHPDRHAMVVAEIEARGQPPPSPRADPGSTRRRALVLMICLAVAILASIARRHVQDTSLQMLLHAASVCMMVWGLAFTSSTFTGKPRLSNHSSGVLRAKPVLKRRWFILPLPMTMLAAGALYILKNDGFAGAHTVQDVFGVLAGITFFGSSAFPVGLPLCFTFGNPDPLVDIVVPIVLSGYLLYFGLSIFGAIRRSRAVLVVLWVLLLLNLIGCQSSVGLLPMTTS